jgi:hypothetical protein
LCLESDKARFEMVRQMPISICVDTSIFELFNEDAVLVVCNPKVFVVSLYVATTKVACFLRDVLNESRKALIKVFDVLDILSALTNRFHCSTSEMMMLSNELRSIALAGA